MAKAASEAEAGQLGSICPYGGRRPRLCRRNEREDRFIITAGHCLPKLPPSHAASYTEERTYAKLVGPVGGEPTVWAECVFVNPVDDLAVLAPLDNQELGDVAPAGAASSGKPA